MSFENLKISSWEPLLENKQRFKCPKCGRSRKYFCYNCFETLGCKFIPKIALPISVEIIHYPTEKLSKSTAVHAKLLAPSNVEIYEFPNDLSTIDQNIDDSESVAVLFPSEDSISVADMKLEDLMKIKKLIVIDSQWKQVSKICRDPLVQGISKKIRINNYKTLFWRYQKHGDDFLATIEAIYYFFKEYHVRLNEGNYDGQFDDLLFYFSFFYRNIQDVYKSENKPFTRKENYLA